MNFTTGAGISELLSLDHIRSHLIRLEDTIIFSLIERAQFAQNPKIYQAGAFERDISFQGSWLEWFLFETESFQAKARRYTSPEEYPFTPIDKLPQPIIAAQEYPTLLYPPAAQHPSVNVNDKILKFYVEKIVPGVTKNEDDGNYGSAATRDMEVLQNLSRRIHFGMFVSESKFLACPSDFIPHILSSPPNAQALADLITKPAVEAKLLVRLENKAKVYGAEMDADGRVVDTGKTRIDVGAIVGMYRDYVIPLTKEVEVDYLIHRLDGVPQSQIDEWMGGLLTIIRKNKAKSKEMRVLFLSLFRPVVNVTSKAYGSGLDNAGKTTILKKLNNEDIGGVSPTLGFNIKTLVRGQYTLNIWDVGGQRTLRPYWRNYFESTDALVWVVDSTDRLRLPDCKDELKGLLREERLAGATLLVFANKQDLGGAMTLEEIRDALDLSSIKSHKWSIRTCSGVTAGGLDEGLDWVIHEVAGRLYWNDTVTQPIRVAGMPAES